MQSYRNITLGLIGLSSALTFAGEPMTTTPDLGVTDTPDFMDKIKFSGDIRARYEYRDEATNVGVGGRNGAYGPANAFTVRGRLGLLLGEFNGFSAFIEGEGTTALVDEYTSNPLPLGLQGANGLTDPYDFGSTFIGDPENHEINRLWVRYQNSGFDVKVGRQRIIRNNAAFVGNVGWRQNEQTFDAAQIAYKNDDFSVSYVYADRVQRIFGNTPPTRHPLGEFIGDIHLFDFSAKTDIGTVGGYAYLIDLDPSEHSFTPPIFSVGDTDTFGLFVESGPLRAEVAYQDGTSSAGPRGALGDYDALYGHLTYSTKAGGMPVQIGVEYLENGFVTPLATVHAFNGFADAFIFNRIGLPFANNQYDGLVDIYSSITKTGLPGGITMKGFLHYYMDDSFDANYGYEADLVLVKKINPSTTALLKAAHFEGEDFFASISQISMQLDYKF